MYENYLLITEIEEMCADLKMQGCEGGHRKLGVRGRVLAALA